MITFDRRRFVWPKLTIGLYVCARACVREQCKIEIVKNRVYNTCVLRFDTIHLQFRPVMTAAQ